MEEKIYKWLPIIFGCHTRADRSFFYKGKKFPICARCTGELIGIIFSLLSSFIYIPSVKLSLILMIPMIIDGFTQSLTKYESNNILRVITGFLFGYGIFSLFVIFTVITFKYGYNLGLQYR